MARPTKTPKPGTQQVTISLRVPVSLKTALEERAAANHRNLSQEAERTLERSFSTEALFADCVMLNIETGPGKDRFTEAATWMRTLARDLFGERASAVGCRFMQTMAQARMLDRAAHPDDIDYFLEAIRELQGTAERADQQASAAPPKDNPSDVAHGKIREGVVYERTQGSRSPAHSPNVGALVEARVAESRNRFQEAKRLKSSVPRAHIASKLGSERPVYLQVRDVLAARIAVGEWKRGTPLPKESDLALEFGVSPAIMRAALVLLEADGLLTRRVPAPRSKGALKPHLYLVHPEAKSA